MLEITFACAILVVLVALGAMISMGNERQRKALQGLREQVQAWTEQDIRLKREKLSREIVVEDPRAWIETTAARLLGSLPGLTTLTPWECEGGQALVGLCKDGRRLVFTPVPQAKFLQMVGANRKGKLAQMDVTILGDNPKRTPVYELSVVNAGLFFDLEDNQVWTQITGQQLVADHLWMYEVPARIGNSR